MKLYAQQELFDKVKDKKLFMGKTEKSFNQI